MRRGRIAYHLVAAVVVVVLVLGWGALAPTAAEPVKIKVGYTVLGAELHPLYWEKPEILKNYGKSYTVEATLFKGSSPQIQAMAANELQITGLAFSSYAIAVVNGQLDVKIIHDIMRDGVKGYFSQTWVTLADSGLSKVEDLKGKRVAINVAGAGVDLGLRSMMRKHKMEDRKDFFITEVAFPNQEVMLRQKKIDAGVLVQPFYDKAMAGGGLQKIFDLGDALGVTQFIMGVAKRDWLEANRQVVVDYLEDFLRAHRWFLDPANREEAVDIAARYSKVPRSVYASWLLTKRDWYRDRSAVPDIEALQRNIDEMASLKFIKSPFEVKKYTDLSYLQAAQKRLTP
ncbi:MAG: ABC transporter substrate-binding protein [Candidatus Tectomicrobia bacterium]|nr:ABC transporter substrate-binding protein [Candidatus Tectomicrobia bacterium]